MTTILTEEEAEQAILSGVGLDESQLSGLRSRDEFIRQVKQSRSPQFRVMASTPEAEEGRVVRFVASDETPDRVGDVIEVAGWNLTSYKQNPVVLWGHDSSNTPPIGRAVNVRRGVGPSGSAALLASIEFAPAEAHEFADTVYQLTKAGFLNAVSVGFLPRGTRDIKDAERQKLGMPSYGLFYTSADLLEISVVSIPANPSALATRAKSLVDSGVLKSKEVDRFLKQVPMNEDQLAERLKSKIRGFVDLGALSSKSTEAEAPAPAAEEEVIAEAPVEEAIKELPTPEQPAEAAVDKPNLYAPEELKHIAAIEETEGTVIITYLKAGYGEESPEGYSDDDDDDDDKPMMGSRMTPALADLVAAQTEQTKALTTLIDAVSDLTKRIHSMGETQVEGQHVDPAPSDGLTSDAQPESSREENALGRKDLEQLTTDFLYRLKSKLR